jgi:YVTN family beta-propeller protein
MSHRIRLCCVTILLALAACRPGSAPPAPGQMAARIQLPTGASLDPARPSFGVGNMPLAIAAAPGPVGRFVLLLSGWREQGLQVIDTGQGKVLQTLPQPGAFLGLAFSPDGKTLYASGGDDDAVWRYDWKDGAATFRDRLELAAKEKDKSGTRFPAGLAVSPDGSRLYVAENLAGSLAVLDAQDGRVLQRLPVGHFPYGVAVAADGTVWASAWGGDTIAAFAPDGSGMLKETARVEAGRHPSALLLNAAGTRLFVASASTDRVAVVDTQAKRVLATLDDPPPSGPAEGSTPNALALSPDGKRLFVAEADANAVAVFALSAATSGVAGGEGKDRLAGRIPVDWYPAALAATSDKTGNTLTVVNGKGRGTGPNPGQPQPDKRMAPTATTYTLGQLNGTVTVLPSAWSDAELATLTQRVDRANGWDRGRPARRYPPFEHVVYILKENRTYDQVLGDMPQGDGDPSLVFFPRRVSPNHHALAERFGLFDRFFVNAEVSNQGHPWSTSGYVTDFLEKTTPSDYSDRRDEGEEGPGEADEPAGGWLWGIAKEKGISFRNYGETMSKAKGPDGSTVWKTPRAGLAEVSNLQYPGWDLSISDQVRADLWIADLHEAEKTGSFPALQLVWLPNDHTSGTRAGLPTPRAYMADNDYALGRMIEALSKSKFWPSTVVFVLEDDAQSGADHVDSHRSVLLVASPYNRPGLIHRFVNTTDVLATIEEILGLRSFSHFDHFGRTLADLFAAEPDLRPYEALPLAVPWTEVNPKPAKVDSAAASLNLSIPDSGQDDLFNRVLWQAIQGDRPYPEERRMPLLELERGR